MVVYSYSHRKNGPMSAQIKSRKRVADFGEVYTAQKQVNDMLALLPDDMPLESTYLEPACGNGNFLAAILKKKLSKALLMGENIDRLFVIAVSSIYGVDIQEDNVLESRNRMLHIMTQAYKSHIGMEMPSCVVNAVSSILKQNIICGNTLTAESADGQPLTFCEWEIKDSGYVICKEYHFSDLIEANGECNKYISKHRYSWLVGERVNVA